MKLRIFFIQNEWKTKWVVRGETNDSTQIERKNQAQQHHSIDGGKWCNNKEWTSRLSDRFESEHFSLEIGEWNDFMSFWSA